MVHQSLINPKSIVVVGASNNIQKPGGKVLKNLLDHKFEGLLYAVNPKEAEVLGVKSYNKVDDLPQTDLAIIAIAAKYCVQTVRVLAEQKGTKAFIILSAGFSEESHEGALLEQEIVKIINDNGGSLIGPNCTGVLNSNYAGAFTTPIPKFSNRGCDLISGSGATALFIMDIGISNGLMFNEVYSVGNSAQLGVEDILKYMDETYSPETSAPVKLLYIENIGNPKMFLKHASSLIRKGCRIAAIKSGGSEAGSRAASSHTGALASSDVAVEALFKKAGIIRCHGRQDLITTACILTYKQLAGKNIAIVTHAGGPAVMLTDILSNNKFNVPKLAGAKADELLSKLFAGSSVSNPIDFLATGTAEQLGTILDYCENDFPEIDGIVVIFGTPGLFPIYDVYQILSDKIKTSKKPIFPILPSQVMVKDEVESFIEKGHAIFPDEVVFGAALAKAFYTPKTEAENIDMPQIDIKTIRSIIDKSENGYISPESISKLLDAAGIKRAGEATVNNIDDAIKEAKKLGFPIVMKVVGPVHKSDVGGVTLNVKNEDVVRSEFERMMNIKDTTAILMQPMLSGTELFAGAKREDKFGHIILCGLGGIFVEVMKDVAGGLSPLSKNAATAMITSLKSKKMFDGIRGQEGISIDKYADTLCRLSALLEAAPEIFEMDLNPLLGKGDNIVAVDARINIQKK